MIPAQKSRTPLVSSGMGRFDGTEDDARSAPVPKHLPAPEGTPDPAARRIIDQITAYLADDRDPVVTATGLRHIYHQAALAWEESLRQARRRGRTWREIREPTGDGLSTIQDRASGRSPRRRAEREGRR